MMSSPVVQLNRAVAVAMAGDLDGGLALVGELVQRDELAAITCSTRPAQTCCGAAVMCSRPGPSTSALSHLRQREAQRGSCAADQRPILSDWPCCRPWRLSEPSNRWVVGAAALLDPPTAGTAGSAHCLSHGGACILRRRSSSASVLGDRRAAGRQTERITALFGGSNAGPLNGIPAIVMVPLPGELATEFPPNESGSGISARRGRACSGRLCTVLAPPVLEATGLVEPQAANPMAHASGHEHDAFHSAPSLASARLHGGNGHPGIRAHC